MAPFKFDLDGIVIDHEAAALDTRTDSEKLHSVYWKLRALKDQLIAGTHPKHTLAEEQRAQLAAYPRRKTPDIVKPSRPLPNVVKASRPLNVDSSNQLRSPTAQKSSYTLQRQRIEARLTSSAQNVASQSHSHSDLVVADGRVPGQALTEVLRRAQEIVKPISGRVKHMDTGRSQEKADGQGKSQSSFDTNDYYSSQVNDLSSVEGPRVAAEEVAPVMYPTNVQPKTTQIVLPGISGNALATSLRVRHVVEPSATKAKPPISEDAPTKLDAPVSSEEDSDYSPPGSVIVNGNGKRDKGKGKAVDIPEIPHTHTAIQNSGTHTNGTSAVYASKSGQPWNDSGADSDYAPEVSILTANNDPGLANGSILQTNPHQDDTAAQLAIPLVNRDSSAPSHIDSSDAEANGGRRQVTNGRSKRAQAQARGGEQTKQPSKQYKKAMDKAERKRIRREKRNIRIERARKDKQITAAPVSLEKPSQSHTQTEKAKRRISTLNETEARSSSKHGPLTIIDPALPPKKRLRVEASSSRLRRQSPAIKQEPVSPPSFIDPLHNSQAVMARPGRFDDAGVSMPAERPRSVAFSDEDGGLEVPTEPEKLFFFRRRVAIDWLNLRGFEARPESVRRLVKALSSQPFDAPQAAGQATAIDQSNSNAVVDQYGHLYRPSEQNAQHFDLTGQTHQAPAQLEPVIMQPPPAPFPAHTELQRLHYPYVYPTMLLPQPFSPPQYYQSYAPMPGQMPAQMTPYSMAGMQPHFHAGHAGYAGHETRARVDDRGRSRSPRRRRRETTYDSYRYGSPGRSPRRRSRDRR